MAFLMCRDMAYRGEVSLHGSVGPRPRAQEPVGEMISAPVVMIALRPDRESRLPGGSVRHGAGASSGRICPHPFDGTPTEC